jgi:hypothetical protein
VNKGLALGSMREGAENFDTRVVRGSERLAWLLLRAVNRAQAKDSTVRLVVPRDPDIVDELGRDLGLGPTDEELVAAEEYLLEQGCIAPTGLGVTRDIYTVTLAGLDWLERDLTALRRASQQQGPSKEAEPLVEIPQHAEDVGSIIVLRGERERLLQELEQQRQRIERLEAELAWRHSPWYERWFG